MARRARGRSNSRKFKGGIHIDCLNHHVTKCIDTLCREKADHSRSVKNGYEIAIVAPATDWVYFCIDNGLQWELAESINGKTCKFISRHNASDNDRHNVGHVVKSALKAGWSVSVDGHAVKCMSDYQRYTLK